ncbi:folate family ECF transporter S component [Carnobacterium viridans]|uniref:ECF transporter S component, folate family n=1 Tax=Carnobacterium viridans TaxID=174587 RepID=A0A1H1AHA7_9LACT|nr:folate family ECF transporter S component [Carnobacterium viridans]UDE96189.1 folate family ECF transporter S component [Carnobacterium viridans]SDQ39133.1 ECF transporter S component, folate family [Carnobacterium viridans]
MSENKYDARSISKIGLLMALEIVLTQFISIETPIVRIGFGFLPIAIIGMLYGPWIAGMASAITDIVGTILFGGGVFFPGFILSAFIGGMIYGLILYKKPKSLKRIIIAILLVTVFVNLGMNTIWLTIMLDKAILVIFPTRLVQNLVLAPVNILLLYFVVQNKTLRKAIGID